MFRLPREECTTDFKCRTNHLPSLLVQPLQFELAKVEEEAELARLHYWGSILMLLSRGRTSLLVSFVSGWL